MANINKRRLQRGFTADGYVRVQRTVLRRVVTDRLQALLRGDFYVRNSLGGEEYEPIVKEVEAISQYNNYYAAAASASTSSQQPPQAPAMTTAEEDTNMREQHEIQKKNGNHGKGMMTMTNGSVNHDSDMPLTTTNITATANQDEMPPPPPPLPPKQVSFSTNLETFLQLIAASIMIDASMRGENAGESDTRFIKKKKKLLVKTLMGPKLPDFCKEVLRYDTVRRGGMVSDTELVESEESQSENSSSSSSSEGSSSEEEVEAKKHWKTTKKVKVLHSSNNNSNNNTSSPPIKEKSQTQPKPCKQVQSNTTTTTSPLEPVVSAAAVAFTHATQPNHQQERPRHHSFFPSSGEEDGSSSMDEEDEDNSTTASDSNEDGISSSANNSKDDVDALSASATSSMKQQRKLEKKKLRQLKKERKRMKKEERRRRKKERKRREKEEKEERRKKRKAEKKRLMMEQGQQQVVVLKDSKKKKKRKHDKSDAAAHNDAESELSDPPRRHNHHQHGEDDVLHTEYITSLSSSSGKLRHSIPNEDIDGTWSDKDDSEEEEEEEEGVLTTKEEFDQYKSDTLKRVPKSVKSRFRQGGFSRWGKDWLPILELGPFDVEPGPVRNMWFDMFNNTQASGRDMTRLVLWYGVKFEDRGQAYSFLPESKIVPYEDGQRNGYCKIPPKIEQKIDKKQKLTKTEEQIRRGLIEIEADMGRDKSERAAWMMQFKEDYEYAEEKAEKKGKKEKLVKASEKESLSTAETLIKRKPGRPKKDETVVPIKRKPGRPKKVVMDVSSAEEEEDRVVVEVKKRGPGRPKKSDKEKLKKREPPAKKWEIMDGDEESEIETDDDESDKDYHDGHVESGADDDMDVDGDTHDSDGVEDKASGKKRKSGASLDKKAKKKAKVFMTEEEKVIDRRAKAAEYREKKARERAEAQGLEYIKGKVGRKSKAAMLEEEQMKFTKCEEIFLPMMELLSEAKDENNVKVVIKCIKSIMERVEVLTPPFLREYPLGMLVKTVRKSFEGVYPEVKENCKRLTAEMKRVYTEKEPKVPDDFEPVKNKKSSIEPKHEPSGENATSALASSTIDSIKSESFIFKADNVTIKTDKVVINADKVDIASEPSLSKQNSEMSLSESLPQKLVGASSSECLPDVVKSQHLPPKQKRTFSIKGMFDKPKLPAETLKTLPTSSSSTSIAAVVPKPKSLPPWVIGPPTKMVEDLCSERAFGLEFLFDAASSAASISKKFDPISVSQSLELAVFAETKMRGRHWNQYWEKIHDVVSLLSPGENKQKPILQGIISGDYQEPSDVVKLTRRDILNSQMTEVT